jgi:hypothetical protein
MPYEHSRPAQVKEVNVKKNKLFDVTPKGMLGNSALW